MKLKFDLQLTQGQTRPPDEDIVVDRYQSVVANPPNRPLSCFFAIERRRCVRRNLVWQFLVGSVLQRVLLSTSSLSLLKLPFSTQMGPGTFLGVPMWAQR